jgi:hypothetical protein
MTGVFSYYLPGVLETDFQILAYLDKGESFAT